MPATGPRRQQHPRALSSAAVGVIVILTLSVACQVQKHGTGYLGGGDGGDGQPPNVARLDGGDTAARADTAPVTPPWNDAAVPPADAAVTPADATVPPIDMAADVAPPPPPPDVAPPVCPAGERRCNGKIPETCSNGTAWTAGAPCPILCSAGMCTGVCQPRSVVCMGSKRRTCRTDASGYDDMDCPAPPGGTAICREATCGFECNDPARRFRCGNACCQCQRHEDCPANNVCTAGACKYQAPVIHITGGFYGRNCQGMNFPAIPPDARPDRTAHLTQACEGKPSCEYDVDHLVIGDPAVGCPKVYEATWQCVSGATRTSHSATLGAEASYGPNLKIVCAP